jgi:UDP-N-acetylmuramate--alanine ligase
MGSNARLGKSQYLVAEADESDRSFLKLSPILAVVTNIDREHMDCYRDMADVEQAFLDFIDRVPFYGMAVLCHDDERLRNMLPRLARRATTYGVHLDADFRVGGARAKCAGNKHYAHFSVEYHGKSLGDFHLRVPGNHNVLNATAAVAVGIGLDIEPGRIREALENFRGVDRRFQLRGRAADVSVIDDYGHHPTEIRATLAAARHCGFKRVHVIFQPHRFTRTRDLLEQFGASFNDADTVLVLDIYAASEAPIPGITGERLAQGIQLFGDQRRTVSYVQSFDDAARQVSALAEPGDMVLTLGAGSVSQLGPMVLEQLKKKQAAISSQQTA